MSTLAIRPLILRLALGLGLAAGFGSLAYFIARAAIGDSIITYVQRAPALASAAQIAGAHLAIDYAPRDPNVRYRSGAALLAAAISEGAGEELAAALAELRTAARMSPDDYRIHLALGRALDRNDQPGEARLAFERATALAPRHFDPRWAYGNHLLRAGDREAAFREFRAALASRPSALDLIFDYAWQSYGGDGPAITRALAPPDAARAQFAALLAARGRPADGLALWRRDGYDRTASEKEARVVTEALIRTGRYADAYDVWYASEKTPHPGPDQGQLLANADFEAPVAVEQFIPFYGWVIGSTPGLIVTLESQKAASGRQALRNSYDVRENVNLVIAAQTVRVKPSTAYRLTFTARALDLNSLSTPLVEVIDPADPTRLAAAAPPLPLGDSEWKKGTIDFTTARATEAITVQVRRPSCNDPPCPLLGRAWFDDFQLTAR
jgi:hypothetical protein